MQSFYRRHIHKVLLLVLLFLTIVGEISSQNGISER